MRRIVSLLVLLLLLVPAQAGVRPLSLADLCSGAERIVIGSVDKLTSRYQGPVIVTDVTVVPTENLKGTGAGPFNVTIPGGTIGTTTLHAGEAPAFAPGEHVVLFVKSAGTPCGVYGWFRGKYTVVGDRIREIPDMPLVRFRADILALVDR